MLYEIAGTNTKIFGSMHRVPPGAAEWRSEVSSLCAWAEEFAVEMLTINAPAMFTEPVGRGVNLLPADLQRKIGAMWPRHWGAFEKANLPGASLFGSVALLRSDAGVEETVEQLAGDDRAIHELEDATGFLKGFAEIPASKFATAVRLALNRSDEYRRTKLQEIYDRWQDSDADGLYAALVSDIPPAFTNAMFAVRSEAWAPKVAALARRPTKLLVCCGAGHLHGPDNLLDYLERDHGLRSTPVLS